MPQPFRRSLTFVPVGLIVVSAVVLWLAPEAAAQEERVAEYVGSDLCQECHAEQWETYSAGTHSSLVYGADEMEGEAGCESCHGPGSLHVELAGTEEPGFREAIIGFSTESADAMASQCLDCHVERGGQEHYTTSLHLSVGVACTECHNTHQARDVPASLEAPEPTLCYECHGDKRAQLNLTERHPVDSGFMTCSDCHTPHGSPNQTALVAAESAVCADCHTDKHGPWVFAHPPAETDGCVACHEPHGSVNAHMLNYREMRFNCLQCHTSQPGFHVQPGFSECTACHTQIHGSNLDPFFLR